MIWTIVLFLIISMVAVMSSSVNYCGARMCANTNAHTFCQFPRWVEELAREAQLWADQCRAPRIPEEHDVCRDLYSTTIGQCVASVVGEAPGLRVESMIDLWYMQNILYKGNVTSYIPPPTDSGFYGDFGQMLWANTYMVGCGRSRFMASSQGRLRSVERLVCNFAPRGPPPSRALWSPALAASACSSRSAPDRSLTSLCTYQPELDETHDVDNSMTLEEHITLNTVLEIEGKDSLNYHGSLDELYLTKLAIITMKNIDTSTPYYNSIQKRDIAEFILLEDAKADIYKISPDKNVLQNISGIENKKQEDNATKNKKSIKKKVRFIGRPKSYNMEDLNDVKNEIKTQNEIRVEEMSQKEKDLYAEYGLIESENENFTIFVESLTESNVDELPLTDDKNNVPRTEFIDITGTSNPVSVTKVEITGNSDTNFNVIPSFLEPLKVKENMEDYANDSETVRELQEALDRMERTLEPTLRGSQGKVRRDLRGVPEKINVEENIIPDGDNTSVSPEELERNKTIERGPMLNMVLKYMPYLKQYEDGILGKTVSGSKRIGSSNVLILFSICLYI